MNPALFFLVRRSLANGLKSRLMRLKSPRYLVPTLVGVLYLVFLFGSGAFFGDGGPSSAQPGGARDRSASLFFEWGIALGLMLMASAAWMRKIRMWASAPLCGISWIRTELAALAVSS